MNVNCYRYKDGLLDGYENGESLLWEETKKALLIYLSKQKLSGYLCNCISEMNNKEGEELLKSKNIIKIKIKWLQVSYEQIYTGNSHN